jgi:hypothetical protein
MESRDAANSFFDEYEMTREASFYTKVGSQGCSLPPEVKFPPCRQNTVTCRYPECFSKMGLTFVEQDLDHGLVPGSGREVERGQSGLGQEVGVGAVVQQEADHLNVAVAGGEVEGRHAALQKKRFFLKLISLLFIYLFLKSFHRNSIS